MAKIAMMMGPDFEDSEYRVPYDRLTQAGHQVTRVGRASDDTVHGKKGKEKASIDMKAGDADPSQFDALVIPGGYSPDQIRTDEAVVSFVRRFAKSGRPVAAVCHGPQLLIEADVVAGKTMTSWPSVKTDLENAGAIWVDKEVVVDGPFITSRKPDDLEAFSRTLLERLGAGSRRSA
jgi:protease I